MAATKRSQKQAAAKRKQQEQKQAQPKQELHEKNVVSKNDGPGAESTELKVPEGMKLVTLEQWNLIEQKVALSGLSQIEKDIIEETKKITKGDVSSCYQLMQYGKELMALERSMPH